MLAFWNSSSASKADLPNSTPLVWFHWMFCFHPAHNLEMKNECAISPDAAMMGELGGGHLMVNQVLQPKLGVFSS